MATPKALASGLGGAIGCDYKRDTHQLFFVEFDGKVSRLDLLPAARVISSGTTTIRGTWSFDFDAGTESAGLTAPRDVFWEQQTTVKRRMRPIGGALLAYLGAVPWSSVTPASLRDLPYSPDSIIGNNNASNQLTSGSTFAVKTGAGNYAKVRVITYGYNIRIRWITYRFASGYRVLGRGYRNPEDLVLSRDGVHAYVTERAGALLKVRLSNARRSAATVVSSGMTAPHQIHLDEERGQAYVVEFAPAGRIFRIDLATGGRTVVAGGIERGIGLLMTQDRRFAYVSQQVAGDNRVVRIDLYDNSRETVAGGLTNPFFLTWSDPGESAILFPERDPANRIARIDLTPSTPTLTRIASGLPSRPSSLALVTANRMLVCSNSVISELDFTDAVYLPSGPILLGIGHVPRDRISQGGPATARGYADTTGDPAYFFQVKDAPFGGTLPINFNHRRAWAEGARYYRLWVGPPAPSATGVEPLQSWNDYRWNTSTNRFELETQTATGGGRYRVRAPSSIWYHPWLAYRLRTTELTNGLHRIRVRTYANATTSTAIHNDSFLVRIDNDWPQASIDEIRHYLATGGSQPVGECAIVDKPGSTFKFRITANDAEGHLKSWHLRALWGNNKSKNVSTRSYTPTPNKKWSGPVAQLVPSSPWNARVAGDPTSVRCAHTFYLTVWDRVINGEDHLHRSTYHRSITIYL